MNILTVTDPRWANAEHTLIDCSVTCDDFPGEVLPFTASPSDVTLYGPHIFADCAAGVYGPVAEHVPTPPYISTVEDNKRIAERRLAATDWVNQPDVYDPANTPHLTNRDAFIAYRSQVRAIAVNPVSGNLDWPTEPAAVWSQA